MSVNSLVNTKNPRPSFYSHNNKNVCLRCFSLTLNTTSVPQSVQANPSYVTSVRKSVLLQVIQYKTCRSCTTLELCHPLGAANYAKKHYDHCCNK